MENPLCPSRLVTRRCDPAAHSAESRRCGTVPLNCACDVRSLRFGVALPAPEIDACRGSRTSRADRLAFRSLAPSAGVHIDFHANRHFHNLWGLPSHSGVLPRLLVHKSTLARAVFKGRAGSNLTQEPESRSGCRREIFTIARRLADGNASSYFSKRNRARPAFEFSSLASSVPSASAFAALKRCSTTARYSSCVSVPS